MSLVGVASHVLTSLRDALASNRVRAPLSRAELLSTGYGSNIDALLAATSGLPRDAVLAVLNSVLEERAHRTPPHLDLVWTGPEARIATARDTAVLVAEMFATAQRHVLIAGFSFDHGDRILAPLHASMRNRNIGVDLFLDFAGNPNAVPAFVARNWPFGPPFPALHYDPRTAEAGARASLHAKCIVADACRTLITSANFTDRGQTRNVELGVVIEDPDFGARVVAQWRALLDAKIFASAVVR